MKARRVKTHNPFVPMAIILSVALIAYGTHINPQSWKIGSTLYGTKSDNFATVWSLRSLTEGASKVSTVRLINFPFLKLPKVSTLDFLTTLPAAWLTHVSNEVFAFNFVLFSSFLLSGLFTHLFVYLLTRQALPSAIFGLAYVIFPYHIAMSQYHFTLARVEVFPLFLLTLTWFLRKPRWYTGFTILVAQFLSFAVDPHYGLFNFLMLLAFLAVYAFYGGEKGWRRPSLSRAGGLLGLAVAAATTGIPRYLTATQGSAEFSLGKPFQQLYAYSARVWDYFVPPAHHPLLGQFTRGFIEAHIHDSYIHEQTLYLGITVVILAGLGTWRLWRSSKPEHRFWGLFLPLVALGGFLFSMPPTIDVFGLQVPMPSYFLWHVLPMFRVYARFGVVVATATMVLAGFGMAWLLERVRAKKTVAMLLGALILFEYLPSFQFVDLSTPPAVYQWLAGREEAKAIAEYPLCWPPEKDGDYLNLWDLYEYMVWQRVHGKPMFNGEPEKRLDMAMKLQLADLLDPNVPPRLAWLGITHIVVHKDRVSPEELQALETTGSVEKVYEDEEAAVYRITGHTALFPPQTFRYPSTVLTEEKERRFKLTLLPGEKQGDQERLVLYGPYLALYTGRYRATFHLSPVAGEVPRVRLAVVADGGRKVLAEREVTVASGEGLPIEFRTDGDLDVEFRVYASGAGLMFGGVEVVQLARGTAHMRGE